MIRIIYVIGVLIKYLFILFLLKFSLYRKEKSQLLKTFFEEIGGSFIKFGQLLALRVDVLPKEYSLAMIDLLDNVKPFSYKEVETIILYELGAMPNEVFKEFDKTPFASASFGQVHAAKFSDKEIIAVKIMRPGIEKIVSIDFFFINILAFVADLFFKIEAMTWKEFASEFKKWTKKELDYYIEAENNDKFYNYYRTVHDKNVVIPQIYTKFSTKHILVQEYIDGIPLSRVLRGLKDGRLNDSKLRKLGINIAKTPRTLMYEILRQYFYFGFYHADPHPGNILLLKGNKIGLIDFGIVGEADPINKNDYIKFLIYTGDMNFRDATYHMSRITGVKMREIIESAFPVTLNNDYIEKLTNILADYFANITANTIRGNMTKLETKKTDYTMVLLRIIKLAEIMKIRLPPQMASYMRALGMLGLLAKELDPSFRISDELKIFFTENPYEKLADKVSQSYTKRMNREKAIELLNNWLAYLFERKPDLYHLVNNYIKSYNGVK